MKFNKFFFFIAFLLLVIIFTYPVLFNLRGRVIGNLFGYDVGGELWLCWWVKKAIFSEKLSLFYTNYLEYPIGENLLVDVGNFLLPILMIPLHSFCTLIPAFNLSIMILMTLNGFFMYLLLNYLNGKKLISFLGGIIFAFNPFMLKVIHYAQIEQVAFCWVILFLLYILKLKNSPKMKYVFLSSLFFILATLSSLHYGIILTIFFIIFIPFYFNKYKKDISFGKLLLVISIILLLLGPAIFSIGLHLENTEYPLIVGGKNIELSDFQNKNGDAFLPPGRDIIMNSSYNLLCFNTGNIILLFVISLIIVPLYFIKKRPYFWISCFFIFLLFAMGPFLKWKGGVTNISLPYLLLYKYFPFFSRFFWPERFLNFVYLFGTIVITYNLNVVIKKFNFSIQRKVVTVLILAFLIIPISYNWSEYDSFLIKSSKIYVPQFYKKIAKEKKDYAIIELPYFSSSHYYLYLQTIHEKKMVNSVRTGEVDFLRNEKYKNFMDKFLQHNEFEIKNLKQAQKLKKLGIKYIIVYPESISYRTWSSLMKTVGKPVKRGQLYVFRL